jgi:hypothetical protein
MSSRILGARIVGVQSHLRFSISITPRVEVWAALFVWTLILVIAVCVLHVILTRIETATRSSESQNDEK